jgi:hypothetical protein
LFAFMALLATVATLVSTCLPPLLRAAPDGACQLSRGLLFVTPVGAAYSI